MGTVIVAQLDEEFLTEALWKMAIVYAAKQTGIKGSEQLE